MTGFEDDFDDVDDKPTVDDLWSAIAELGERIDLLIADLATVPGPRVKGEWMYGSVDDWVNAWWRVHFARDLSSSQIVWCEKWWDHPEALSRLTGLWERWEDLRLESGGLATWWREADICTSALMSPAGPFRLCKTGESPRHRVIDPLRASPTGEDSSDPFDS
jgi:hypothetical protein